MDSTDINIIWYSCGCSLLAWLTFTWSHAINLSWWLHQCGSHTQLISNNNSWSLAMCRGVSDRQTLHAIPVIVHASFTPLLVNNYLQLHKILSLCQPHNVQHACLSVTISFYREPFIPLLLLYKSLALLLHVQLHESSFIFIITFCKSLFTLFFHLASP